MKNSPRTGLLLQLLSGIAPIVSALAGGAIGCRSRLGYFDSENFSWIAVFALPLAFIGIILTAAVGLLVHKKNLRSGQTFWLIAVVNLVTFTMAAWFLEEVSGV